MIKAAFCDDDDTVLKELQSLLEEYRRERDYRIDAKVYHSPLDLLNEMEKGTRFDILFLDILMPGVDGIQTASEIRKFDNNIKIIFLTSSVEFAVQSYEVKAYYYQLKPIEKEHGSSIVLRCKTGIARIALKQLEYCEVIHRTLLIHLTDGTVYECSGSMDELGRQLMPYGTFIRPHRSYLVNLEYIKNLSYRTITMSSLVEIPIPRGKYNEIKSAFLKNAFEDGQVTL